MEKTRKKTGLSKLQGYERPLQPKERVNRRLDIRKAQAVIVDAFSAFSEEQADRNKRVYKTDVEKRTAERENRRRESARLKAVRAEAERSQLPKRDKITVTARQKSVVSRVPSSDWL